MAIIRPATRLRAQAATVEGRGPRLIEGAGDVEAANAVIAATAHVGPEGVGALLAQRAQVEGTGVGGHQGSGVVQSQPAQVSGTDLEFSGPHAHFDFLLSQPNPKDSYSFRSQEDVEALWHGSQGTTDPKYDAAEQSYRYDFHGVQSCSGGTNPFKQMHAPVTGDVGTYLVFWETLYDALWGDHANHFTNREGPNGIWSGTHKMSQLQGGAQDGTDPDMTISCYYPVRAAIPEPFVVRWPAVSARGGWPSIGSDDLIANTFDFKAGVWTRRWVFFDGPGGLFHFWAGDVDRAPVRLSGDSEVTFSASTSGQQQITNFRIGEWNISQSPDNSGCPLTPVWEKDIAILRGLTLAEAQALIDHPSATVF